jgi:allantoate deiminase
VCEQRGITWRVEDYQRVLPNLCSDDLQNTIASACKLAKVDPVYMLSGAGHDALQFRGVCPIGMIFVRSKDGISHNPNEWSSMEDCEKGAELLYHTVLLMNK